MTLNPQTVPIYSCASRRRMPDDPTRSASSPSRSGRRPWLSRDDRGHARRRPSPVRRRRSARQPGRLRRGHPPRQAVVRGRRQPAAPERSHAVEPPGGLDLRPGRSAQDGLSLRTKAPPRDRLERPRAASCARLSRSRSAFPGCNCRTRWSPACARHHNPRLRPAHDVDLARSDGRRPTTDRPSEFDRTTRNGSSHHAHEDSFPCASISPSMPRVGTHEAMPPESVHRDLFWNHHERLRRNRS